MRLLLPVLLLLASGMILVGADEEECKPETTLVLLKPDAVSRGHVGAAISMFEAKGMEIVGLKYHERASEDLLKEHYREHATRKFFPELVSSMSAGPIIALKVKGAKAVARVRKMLGATDPALADAGTLRGLWGIDKTRNFAHASDSPEAAVREEALWL